MPIFRIRFIKTVSNDTGHERQVCQRAVEIEAEDALAALGPARAAFCELEQIPDWSYRADCCEAEVVQAFTPSHTQPAQWPARSC
jgi:hypothetical protein